MIWSLNTIKGSQVMQNYYLLEVTGAFRKKKKRKEKRWVQKASSRRQATRNAPVTHFQTFVELKSYSSRYEATATQPTSPSCSIQPSKRTELSNFW